MSTALVLEPTNNTLASSLSDPSNWCDTRCERCPIAASCALGRRERAARLRALTPVPSPPSSPAPFADEMDVFFEQLGNELDRITEALEAAAAAEGIDLAAPVTAPPVLLDTVRFEAAAFALMCAIDVCERTTRATELRRLSTLLAIKAARIACDLGGHHREFFECDVAPNLLLMERIVGELTVHMARLTLSAPDGSTAAPATALAEVDALLRPLIAAVPPETHALVDGLVRRGAAPSPFL